MPQTISYDGDPFDILVLGPALDGGNLVRGVIVGVMLMEDEKGHDSKVIVSLQRPDGGLLHELTERDRRQIGDYSGITGTASRGSVRRSPAGDRPRKVWHTSGRRMRFS